jgi:hypothetical protein
VQHGRHDSDWRFKAVFTRLDPPQVSERDCQPYRPVTAHPQCVHVVEKDGARRIGRIGGGAQEASDENIGPARLEDNGLAEALVLVPEALCAIGDWARAEVWATGENHPGGLTSSVRINH